MKMIRHKKAKTFERVLLIAILLVAVSGVGVITFYAQKQTGLQEKEETQTTEEASESKNAGEITVLKSWAVDKQANTETQVLVPAYYYLKNEDGSFDKWIGGTSGYTLSATATTSVSPVVIGQTVYGTAFNGSYYGDENSQKIQIEGEQLKLDVHSICPKGLEMKIFDETNNEAKNLSVGASQSNSFDRLKFRNNNSDCAYNLAGFYIDLTSTGSNITTIVIDGDASYTGITKTSTSLEREKDKDDLVYALDSPIMLKESQKWFSGDVTVTADGDGCTNQGESVNVYAFDEAKFLKKDGSGIGSGWENDADSPADVGGGDVHLLLSATTTETSFYCKASLP